MTEPDPGPQVEATIMANGSGPLKDSGAKVSVTNSHGEEKKDIKEGEVKKENDCTEEMINREGKQGAEETNNGKEKNDLEDEDKKVGNLESNREEKQDVEETNDRKETNGVETENDKKDGKSEKSVEETNKGEENNDATETGMVEEAKQKGEDKRKIEEINGGKETKEGGDQSGMKDLNDEREKKNAEEKEGDEKMKDVEEIRDVREKEGLEVKKDEGKMDIEETTEDKEEGKREKATVDVEMQDAGDVKEEEKVSTVETGEDEGVKLGESDVKEKEDGGNTEVGDDNKKIGELKKKRSRSGRRVGDKGGAKERKEGERTGEEKEKKGGMKKAKELLSSPISSIERPVRERKTVERLVEVIEKEPNRGVVIEKGHGTPLKDIPNVAHKLARKKPADLKLLHQTLFGRKGKAVDFKNHILRFSGFSWHESDDKQRAKVKERLDKCVKDALLDLCDLLDISVSKANTRKEDIIGKLVDFLAAPHATTDVLLAEKEQLSPKLRKRKRASASKSTEDVVVKRSRKKRMKSEGTLSSRDKSAIDTEDEDEHDEYEDEHEEEDNENVVTNEDEELEHSESEKENESEEAHEKDDDESEDEDDKESGKGKKGVKTTSKKQNSSKKEKVKTESSSKKIAPMTAAKSPTKTPSSARLKSDESNDLGEKVFVRKKKIVEPPKKRSAAKQDVKEKSKGKRGTGGKAKSEGAGQSNPSKEELRKTICEILKKVDFNTATFTDILKQLATYYKVDLTPRKAAIKLMIQEELTKLADEAEEDEDDNEDEDSDKEELPEPKSKKVKVKV